MVAITVAPYSPGVEELKVQVEVVVVGTVILGQEPVTPVGEEETRKLTVPWKPPEAVIVITSFTDAPVLKLTSPEAGLMLKSAGTTVTT